MNATVEHHPENGWAPWIVRLEARGRSAWFPYRERVTAEYAAKYELAGLTAEFNRVWS